MLEGDDEFLRAAGERLEGYFPGLPERIDKLHAEQLGRGIVIKDYQLGSAPPRDELIGYILAVSKDQREHLVLLKTGDIFVISPLTLPVSAEMAQKDVDQEYIAQTSPASIPVELAKNVYPNIDRFVGNPHLRTHLWADIKMRNSNPENVPHILAKIDQAMAVAKETKAERDQAKEESAQQLMTKIDELLNPKKPNPPAEPPSAPLQ